MIYIVFDCSASGKGGVVILGTTHLQDATDFARLASTPGGLSHSHQGGLHEVYELEDGEIYAPDLSPIARFENGEEL